MIVLHPSRKKDGTGPLTVCSSSLTMELVYFISIQAVRSLIHKSLSKFEAVYGAYSCHLAGNTPSLDPRIYEVDFFYCLCRQVMVLTLVFNYSCLAYFQL